MDKLIKKRTRIILSIISAVFFILTLAAPLVSSIMQDYYKGFVGSANTEAMLEKKAMWSQIGETKIFFIFDECYYLSFGRTFCIY